MSLMSKARPEHFKSLKYICFKSKLNSLHLTLIQILTSAFSPDLRILQNFKYCSITFYY